LKKKDEKNLKKNEGIEKEARKKKKAFVILFVFCFSFLSFFEKLKTKNKINKDL